MDNNIFEDPKWNPAKDELEKMNTTLMEAFEIIYPAYKTFVNKCQNKKWLRKNAYTTEQIFITYLFFIEHTYNAITEQYISEVSDNEFYSYYEAEIVETETYLTALLFIMGCKTLHPEIYGLKDNWTLIEEHLKSEHKDNYETFIQKVKANQIKFKKAHAQEAFEQLQKKCAMLTEELSQCKMDLNSLPDKIYTEIIQKAQDAINRGDDISAMKVTLFSLLPPTYSETIMLLHRQPNSMVNHFHDGSTCNQAETINNHINE